MNHKRILYSVVFYLLCMSLVLTWKPSMVFDRDGRPKGYGVERGETVFSLGVLSVVMAIVCFYAFALVDYLFQA